MRVLSAAYGGFPVAMGVHVNGPRCSKLRDKEVGVLPNERVRLENQELSVLDEGKADVGQNLQGCLLLGQTFRSTRVACWCRSS